MGTEGGGRGLQLLLAGRPAALSHRLLLLQYDLPSILLSQSTTEHAVRVRTINFITHLNPSTELDGKLRTQVNVGIILVTNLQKQLSTGNEKLETKCGCPF